ncbi:MAG: cell envelope integrity protein TolA [bacterium]
MPADRRYFSKILGATLLLHALVLTLNPDWFFSMPIVNLEESIAVDADFMSDITLNAPQENALPNAKKSEDVAVPSNLLPQLPKKFEVEEQLKTEEKSLADKKEQDIADEADKKQTVPVEKLESQKTQDDPNKVSKEDLLKRLAVERLKQQNKVDKQMKAQKDALAKLKEELVAKDANKNSSLGGAVGVGAIRAKNYADLLRAAVKRNLYLPKTFEYDRAQLVTQLSVVLNARGELVDVRLAKSSGNVAYDQAAIAALQNSVPLPQPPSEFVGQAITFNLSK